MFLAKYSLKNKYNNGAKNQYNSELKAFHSIYLITFCEMVNLPSFLFRINTQYFIGSESVSWWNETRIY